MAQSPGDTPDKQNNAQPAAALSRARLRELALANRILFRYRVVDAFGHVSMRHDHDPGRFLLARNMAPALVTEDDLIEFDLDGHPVNASGRKVYLERFIHGEIYRARPDVMAIVHSHAPEVIPFGVVPTVKLQPLWHMSGFLGASAPVFEIRDVTGDDSDLLIRSNALGVDLARALGDNTVVLMRGHGATVVGRTLSEAVFRSVYTQLNAEIQWRAQSLGEVRYLTPGETQATTDTNSGQIERAWQLWAREAEQDWHS